jgi:hypothetical protein
MVGILTEHPLCKMLIFYQPKQITDSTFGRKKEDSAAVNIFVDCIYEIQSLGGSSTGVLYMGQVVVLVRYIWDR